MFLTITSVGGQTDCGKEAHPMKIRKMEERFGFSPEIIPGIRKIVFTRSTTDDFYDMGQRMEHSGSRGGILRFYDLESGEVYCPFEQVRNVIYGKPFFSDGSFFFLQGDFNAGKMTLFRWVFDAEPEEVCVFAVEDVDLYNLRIIGNGVHVVSENGRTFRCYYPEQFEIGLEPNETVCAVDAGKVYIDAWIEEGWDSENNTAADSYAFYSMLVVKDDSGNLISREKGSLEQLPDGTWALF